MIVISNEELIRAVSLIINAISDIGQDVHVIEDDYYWSFLEGEKYDMESDPCEFTVGQLSHDVERIKILLSENDQPIAYSLVWLSSVLRYIGEHSSR